MNTHNCDNAIAQLYFYLDGEITWWKRVRVKRHLGRCQRCSGAYGFESHLLRVISDRLQEDPHPEVISRLLGFLRENEDGFGS